MVCKLEGTAFTLFGFLVLILTFYDILRQKQELSYKELFESIDWKELIHSSVFGFVTILIYIILTNIVIHRWNEILCSKDNDPRIKTVIISHIVVLAISMTIARLIQQLLELKVPTDAPKNYTFADAIGILVGGIIGLLFVR